MDIVWLLAIASLTNIACFVIGAKVGQKVVKGEPIETPTVNPMDVYRKHQAQKEAETEKNKIDTILRNIDSYNGTDYGQEDVR
jgi:hypothetical protein